MIQCPLSNAKNRRESDTMHNSIKNKTMSQSVNVNDHVSNPRHQRRAATSSVNRNLQINYLDRPVCQTKRIAVQHFGSAPQYGRFRVITFRFTRCRRQIFSRGIKDQSFKGRQSFSYLYFLTPLYKINYRSLEELIEGIKRRMRIKKKVTCYCVIIYLNF